MANPLPLVLAPDERLHQRCSPMGDTAQVKDLAEQMLATMYANNGIGLAAPQVGHMVRLVVMDCSEGRNQPMVLVNPEIRQQFGAIEVVEGCLSFPGVQIKVPRYSHSVVCFQTPEGGQVKLALGGLWSICAQHEIDHLDGITFDMRGRAGQGSLG